MGEMYITFEEYSSQFSNVCILIHFQGGEGKKNHVMDTWTSNENVSFKLDSDFTFYSIFYRQTVVTWDLPHKIVSASQFLYCLIRYLLLFVIMNLGRYLFFVMKIFFYLWKDVTMKSVPHIREVCWSFSVTLCVKCKVHTEDKSGSALKNGWK